MEAISLESKNLAKMEMVMDVEICPVGISSLISSKVKDLTDSTS